MASAMNHLLDPCQIGNLTCNSRIVMAPRTHVCMGSDGVPTALAADFYAQHAVGGMLVTEAANVSPMSAAFELAPGIYDDAQMTGWKLVADAVHARCGKVFMPLCHSGRVSSYALLKGKSPLSPSGMNEDLGLLQVYGALRNGYYTRIAASPSRAMSLEDIAAAVREFRGGALRALRAGLDGVEIHAGNGYLPQQFLSPMVNRRIDAYGGRIENRARFLCEILESLCGVMPAQRIGVRISPFARDNNASDPGTAATYTYVARMLQEAGVGYVHVADSSDWRGRTDPHRILNLIRPHYNGALILNAGVSLAVGAELIASDRADMMVMNTPRPPADLLAPHNEVYEDSAASSV